MRRRFVDLPRRTRARIRADLDDELRHHFDMRTKELMQRGMSEADAQREAHREFGDVEYTTRYCLAEDAMTNSETRRSDFMADLRQDAAHAWRTMIRGPGFTAVALLTLAIGIGATTAIYSAVNALLLRDLPYRDASEVVRVWGAWADSPDRRGQVSAADFVDIRERQRSFTAMGAFGWGGATFIGADESVALPGLRVDGRVFDVLGVRSLLGRTITEADIGAANPAVLVGYGMWQRLLGGDSSVVGRTINLNGRMRTVVGVLGPDFFFPSASEAEFFTPYDLTPITNDPVRGRRFRHLGAVARLRPGTTVATADAEIQAIMRRLTTEHPTTNENMSARAYAVRDAVSGDVRPALLLLLGASLLVLLIACANVASMLLARAVARRQELAVRAALGAGRGRLVRQLVTESLVLAVCGGVGGLLIAWWGSSAISTAAASTVPLASFVRLDMSVLGTALALTLLSGLMFGLVPALSSSRLMAASLGEGTRGNTGGGTRLRMALVTGQLALSVVLLVGAGLLTRSLMHLRDVDLGYSLDSALGFEMILAGEKYRAPNAQVQFWDAMFDGIRAVPGVVAVGGSGNLPIRGGSTASLAIEGKPQPEGKLPEVGYQPVSDDWFTAMRIPLRSGRFFSTADHDSAPGAVIVSEGFARQYWPNGDIIGARVRLGPDPSGPWNTIVGVVGDVRTGVADQVRPIAYVSARQVQWGGLAVVVRTTVDPMTILPSVRRIVRSLDPALPVASAASLRDTQSEILTDRRLTMQLLTAFALAALALAAVGVYGVMAFFVAARSREIGVRMALGARPREVFTMVVRQSLIPAAVGLTIGVVAALLLGRVMTGLLYGVSPNDAGTFVVVSALLLAVTVLACLIPARRAVAVDPLVAMRSD